jgi:hypothetical protein
MAARGGQSAAIHGSVTMQTQEFVNRSHLDVPTLDAWIDAAWLTPTSHEPG